MTATPHLYYWSKVWGFEWAALQMSEFTAITKKYLPNAGVGANFESGDLQPAARVLSFCCTPLSLVRQ